MNDDDTDLFIISMLISCCFKNNWQILSGKICLFLFYIYHFPCSYFLSLFISFSFYILLLYISLNPPFSLFHSLFSICDFSSLYLNYYPALFSLALSLFFVSFSSQILAFKYWVNRIIKKIIFYEKKKINQKFSIILKSHKSKIFDYFKKS